MVIVGGGTVVVAGVEGMVEVTGGEFGSGRAAECFGLVFTS